MEELQDASIHHTAAKLINTIKTLKNYEPLYENVQKLVCSPAVDRNDMCNTLEEAIKSAGLETEIRNIIFHLVRSKLKPEEKPSQININDPLAYLKRAGVQWDRRVRKSLNAMCSELKMASQGQPRVATDRDELMTKWDELSNYTIDLANYRPVYAPKDILDVLLSLKGPSKAVENTEFVQVPKWEFSHISLPVKNLFELRNHYNDLLRTESYGGSTDMNLQCQRVLESKHAPLCQHLLRKGNTPAPYRGALWSYVLGSHINNFDIDHWNRLKATVLSTDHIVDKLVFKDIQLTASNDDQYFVFEDVLYQVLLCFSRDTEIAQMIQFEHYPIKGKNYEAPPSGVVPFHGICMFAAPFCYLFDSPINLYFTFRAFYIRYCHRLTTINTHPQGIVSICLLFEKLLQTHEPQLWSHFRELQIQPIRVVFKWLMRAFSGHLPPDQLLVLWDLILGFDSLEILSIFAIIILSFRKESLMQVNSLDNIEAILADLSSIQVLPLIQLALSRD
ncbi:TBC1 domain family member 19 isoform X1 [Stomoxys calcitrans]|uniref:Rab-GAP TBC domain-containing protein n=2 Tax=Stomoxys calcitrans TaxID=35570 RepID=A0A1I8NVJ3_STOCA|nr:TBC1 domain family member 19 isoform X1 [Stomoxys calcitrans]